jgi:hypothetical protein
MNELKTRKHWEKLPAALMERFAFNAAYVFDRPGEAADALKRLVLLLESEFFPGRLQQIAYAADWRYEVSILCSHLEQLALQCDSREGLAVADSATTGMLVCERYALSSYTRLARLSLIYGRNREQAALWCERYRRAESDLLCEDESNLDDYTIAVRECLDPDKVRQTAEEMRRVLPKELLEKHVPDFDAADCLTPREVVEQIEELIGIQQVT